MLGPAYARPHFSFLKRLKAAPIATPTIRPQWQRAGLAQVRSHDLTQSLSEATESEMANAESEEDIPERFKHLDPETRRSILNTPLPRSIQAAYLRPLRRTPKHGLPVCDLQLRSFGVRNLELFADFAMRAAYYLNLPAKGPVPLPRTTERWTVPRSNFVHKKSQENFERVTLRRLIQIQDGHPETVQIWLGYLEKRAYHGIGMKANVYEFEELDVGKKMDEEAARIDEEMEREWANFGTRKNAANKLGRLLSDEAFSKMPIDMEQVYREPIEIKRKKT